MALLHTNDSSGKPLCGTTSIGLGLVVTAAEQATCPGCREVVRRQHVAEELERFPPAERVGIEVIHAADPDSSDVTLCGSSARCVTVEPASVRAPTCRWCIAVLRDRDAAARAASAANRWADWRELGTELGSLACEILRFARARLKSRTRQAVSRMVKLEQLLALVLVLGMSACGFVEEGTPVAATSHARAPRPDGHRIDDGGEDLGDASSSSSSGEDLDDASSSSSSGEDLDDASSSSSSGDDLDDASSSSDGSSSSDAGDDTGLSCELDLCAYSDDAAEATCSSCTALVCDADPFCCSSAWDATCIDAAVDLCDLECP